MHSMGVLRMIATDKGDRKRSPVRLALLFPYFYWHDLLLHFRRIINRNYYNFYDLLLPPFLGWYFDSARTSTKNPRSPLIQSTINLIRDQWMVNTLRERRQWFFCGNSQALHTWRIKTICNYRFAILTGEWRTWMQQLNRQNAHCSSHCTGTSRQADRHNDRSFNGP